MRGCEADRRESQEVPTFLYVMPLDNGCGRRVFLEETELVAAEAVDFEKLKRRLYQAAQGSTTFRVKRCTRRSCR